jgi:hypothetical protein
VGKEKQEAGEQEVTEKIAQSLAATKEQERDEPPRRRDEEEYGFTEDASSRAFLNRRKRR